MRTGNRRIEDIPLPCVITTYRRRGACACVYSCTYTHPSRYICLWKHGLAAMATAVTTCCYHSSKLKAPKAREGEEFQICAPANQPASQPVNQSYGRPTNQATNRAGKLVRSSPPSVVRPRACAAIWRKGVRKLFVEVYCAGSAVILVGGDKIVSQGYPARRVR